MPHQGTEVIPSFRRLGPFTCGTSYAFLTQFPHLENGDNDLNASCLLPGGVSWDNSHDNSDIYVAGSVLREVTFLWGTGVPGSKQLGYFWRKRARERLGSGETSGEGSL